MSFLWVLMKGWMIKKYEYEKGLVSICNGGGGVASFIIRVFNFWQFWFLRDNIGVIPKTFLMVLGQESI